MDDKRCRQRVLSSSVIVLCASRSVQTYLLRYSSVILYSSQSKYDYITYYYVHPSVFPRMSVSLEFDIHNYQQTLIIVLSKETINVC